MGQSDPAPKKLKYCSDPLPLHHHVHHHHQPSKPSKPSANNNHNNNSKYFTEYHVREKKEKLIRHGYFTTPGDKYNNFTYQHDHPPPLPLGPAIRHHPQFDYIRHNLYIKSCVSAERSECVFKFQVKNVSFRNYTPKILNQEINMGMWM